MQVTPAAIEAVEQQVTEVRARTGCTRPAVITRHGRAPRLGFHFREGAKVGDVIDGARVLKIV